METIIPETPNFRQRITRLVRGPVASPSYVLTSWLFLRLLGLMYCVAFVSWWGQTAGLIGNHGIAPLSDFLSTVQHQLGSAAYWQVPTLTWFNSSDSFLNVLCGIGTLAAILVIFDVLTQPALIVLWVLYLSLLNAGQYFMSFQWDILLLEVGFLAIFLAPLHLLPRFARVHSPSRLIIWLFRILLFRLILESGYVKLASGDPTWRNLTATTYHYWTQPLPSPLAWYMNLLPLGFHQLEVLFTFFIELIVPFLIFAPRRLRFVAAGGIILLQVLILLTGNYTFFNFLTIALCVLLLDDAFLRRFVPARWRDRFAANIQPQPVYRRILAIAVAIVIGFLNIVQFGETFFSDAVPASASQMPHQLDSLHLVNGYGLFASMTTSRPEIIIEGSDDGTTWLPYEFKYKASDLSRSPAWVEPFQPRLDWQMWFVALEGSPDAEGWFRTFLQRLLEGSPDVLALLGNNPFPDHPPRFVRAELYNYTFTDSKTHQATGQWWQREKVSEFVPATSLSQLP